MLLAIDVGNTNTVFGLFSGEDLVCQWRLSTSAHRSADEYQAALYALAAGAGIDLATQVQAVAIGSVAPQVTDTLQRLSSLWLRRQPLVIHVGLDLGLPVRVRYPERVGVDRLLNAIAASHGYGAPCISLDFGTATKFDVVDKHGAFVGGAIAPGLAVVSESLVARTAQLPSIAFQPPPSPIGDDTVSAMQSGIVLGYLSLVEGLLSRIQAALGGAPAPVVATGGLAPVVVPHLQSAIHHEPDLTLHGLRMVHARHQAASPAPLPKPSRTDA